MTHAIAVANSQLPSRGNDWIRKDSVAYHRDERSVVNYFSITVAEEQREFYRKLCREDDLIKRLLGMEDNSFFISKRVNLSVVFKFEDGEEIRSVVLSPKELKELAESKMSGKDITEWIYFNMAMSLRSISPIRVDECTSIMGADFNRSNMEITIYWHLDDGCVFDEIELREGIREYLAEVVIYNQKNIVELETHMNQSVYRRSDYPMRLTMVCNGGNVGTITESILSTDVIAN